MRRQNLNWNPCLWYQILLNKIILNLLSSVNRLDLKWMLITLVQNKKINQKANNTHSLNYPTEVLLILQDTGIRMSIHKELCPSQAGHKSESRTKKYTRWLNIYSQDECLQSLPPPTLMFWHILKNGAEGTRGAPRRGVLKQSKKEKCPSSSNITPIFYALQKSQNIIHIFTVVRAIRSKCENFHSRIRTSWAKLVPSIPAVPPQPQSDTHTTGDWKSFLLVAGRQRRRNLPHSLPHPVCPAKEGVAGLLSKGASQRVWESEIIIFTVRNICPKVII